MCALRVASRASRAADVVTTQRVSGAGVIVDPAGHIVMNAHWFGAQRLRAYKVDGRNRAALPFGDSDAACTRTPRGLTHTHTHTPQHELTQDAESLIVVSFWIGVYLDVDRR